MKQEIKVIELRFFVDREGEMGQPSVYAEYHKFHKDKNGRTLSKSEKIQRKVSLKVLGEDEPQKIHDFAVEIIKRIEAL